MPSVPRRWPSGTVALLATGPSLTPDVCDAVRGQVDGVVAINDAHRLAPWADVLYSSDGLWWTRYAGVPDFAGQRYGLSPGLRAAARPLPGLPDIAMLRYTGIDGLETDPTGLRSGHNSGYAAINLAVHLGASRILLCGYNLGVPAGQPVHFFGNHPRGLTQNVGLFARWRPLFDTLVAPLAAAGVTVLNCTPDSMLDSFPRVPLAEALAQPVERVAS